MKTKMQDDLEDIPMAYLWYVVLAIMAIVAAAVTLVIRLFLYVSASVPPEYKLSSYQDAECSIVFRIVLAQLRS